MITSRESIYSALFAQIQSALLTPAGPFLTVSRRWVDPSQIAPADRPAIYQVETGEVASTSGKIAGLPLAFNLKVDLVLYTSGSTDASVIPSQELNSLLDAVESSLPNVAKGFSQSLGGKVYNARIDGKIEIVENVAGVMAMAVVPVLLVQGS